MRFKSKIVDNYRIYAVTGTNTVSFGIDYRTANTKGLLGFSVKRTYPDNTEHFMPGFKVFLTHKDKVTPGNLTTTETDPIQSFVWDDFTLKPDEEYTYTFIPVKGKPDDLQQQKPIVIKIRTEPSFSKQSHDIFFNRGVASSQAYGREFNNTSPDKLVGKKQQDAFNWLGRDLPVAIFRFIDQAKKGDSLFGCFYEFNYLPVLQEFKKAIDRGVHVKLIVDAKNNKDKTPITQTKAALTKAKIPAANIIYRKANKNVLQHNKFMVFLQAGKTKPSAVWTGSTNITESGIFGQTNVGHWVRDTTLATLYKKYWDLLSKDPGPKDNDTAANKKKEKTAYITDVMNIQHDLNGSIPTGVTPIFSPRKSLDMLTKYFDLIDKSQHVGSITLAFGINAGLKDLLEKHNGGSPISFLLLEKEDKATAKTKDTFIPLTATNNVYQAFGSFIKDPLYEWTKETNMQQLGITKFVTYIHSKFLLQDPLGANPVVISGSANFSANSTTGNDENMIIIQGNLRVADIYFTEFNRLFNHYYFRAVLSQLKDKKVKDDKKSYYLDDTDGWTKAYKPGSLRQKRVDMYVNMEKTATL